MKYEIPKEIKAKPTLMGLQMKELVILLISSLLIFTVLRETVHSVFIIPYFAVAILMMIYFFVPSRHNPTKKNYESLILFFKQDKNTYHSMDLQKQINQLFHEVESSEKGEIKHE